MNFKAVLLKPLVLSFFLIQICCKKENTESEEPLKKVTAVNIDKNYQKDEPLTNNEKLKVKSVIHFSKKYNSPELWQYKWDMKTGSLDGVHALANGNMLFVIEESDENRSNNTAFVLILDKEGKEIKKQKLALKPKIKYDLFTTQVETDNQGGFTLFIKKEDRSLNQSVEEQSGEGRMRYNLKGYHIDKLKFNNTYSGYETVSKSMETILLKSFQEKGITYIPTGNFYVEYLKGKIFVYGQVGKSELEQMPFVAILDTNLKVVKMNVFEQYVDTKINTIKLNSNGGLYIEGIENTSADGYYYATNKRFTVNSDLKVTIDKSDKEPYESVYRGPSAPEESDEDESETETSEKETQESVVEPAKEETWSTVTFYKDDVEKETYNFKQKGMFSNKIIFEKMSSDNTALWQIGFIFPDNYEVAYINSSEGFKRANGDFVFWLYLTDKSDGDEKQSVAIFVINKEGRLIRQFQTPGYRGITEFRMTESNGQLTTGMIKYDSEYAFYSFAYPLD